MNTSGTNAPATVLSVLWVVAALLIGAFAHNSGLFLGYLLPGLLLLAAALTRLSLLMAKQWEKAVVLRFGKLHAVRGPGLFAIVPFIDQVIWRKPKAGANTQEVCRKYGICNASGVSATAIYLRALFVGICSICAISAIPASVARSGTDQPIDAGTKSTRQQMPLPNSVCE